MPNRLDCDSRLSPTGKVGWGSAHAGANRSPARRPDRNVGFETGPTNLWVPAAVSRTPEPNRLSRVPRGCAPSRRHWRFSFVRSVRLPPSPRLRRTAVALAEAGQADLPRGPAKAGHYVQRHPPRRTPAARRNPPDSDILVETSGARRQKMQIASRIRTFAGALG